MENIMFVSQVACGVAALITIIVMIPATYRWYYRKYNKGVYIELVLNHKHIPLQDHMMFVSEAVQRGIFDDNRGYEVWYAQLVSNISITRCSVRFISKNKHGCEHVMLGQQLATWHGFNYILSNNDKIRTDSEVLSFSVNSMVSMSLNGHWVQDDDFDIRCDHEYATIFPWHPTPVTASNNMIGASTDSALLGVDTLKQLPTHAIIYDHDRNIKFTVRVKITNSL